MSHNITLALSTFLSSCAHLNVLTFIHSFTKRRNEIRHKMRGKVLGVASMYVNWNQSSSPESNATKSEKNKNIQIAFIFPCLP